MTNKTIYIIALLLYSCVGFGQGSWTRKADFGGGDRWETVGFSIHGKGYFAFGSNANDIWEYDPSSDVWEQKTSLPVSARTESIGFVVDGKAYVQCSNDSITFWAYDPIPDTWTPKTDWGFNLYDHVAFAINGKGYVCSGWTGDICSTNVWEYDPTSDSWTQKSDMPECRFAAVAFVIDNVAYVGTGMDYETLVSGTKSFWKYEPDIDTWTPIADFGGIGRREAVAFVIDGKGYVGTGGTNEGGFQAFKDFWEYNPLTDNWAQVADLPAPARGVAGSFSIGSKGYVGTGSDALSHDFWEYNPKSSVDGIAYDYNTNLFSLYPNPSAGSIRVEMKKPSIFQFKVFNSIGGLLQSEHSEISTSYDYNLPSSNGIYFVQLTDADGNTQTIKVIKE